jgi:hypothetical protein
MSLARIIGKENRQLGTSPCTGFGHMPDIVHMMMVAWSTTPSRKLANPVAFSQPVGSHLGGLKIFPGRFFQGTLCAAHLQDRWQVFTVGQVTRHRRAAADRHAPTARRP